MTGKRLGKEARNLRTGAVDFATGRNAEFNERFRSGAQRLGLVTSLVAAQAADSVRASELQSGGTGNLSSAISGVSGAGQGAFAASLITSNPLAIATVGIVSGLNAAATASQEFAQELANNRLTEALDKSAKAITDFENAEGERSTKQL